MKPALLAFVLAAAAQATEIRVAVAGDEVVPAMTVQVAYAQTAWMYGRLGLRIRWQHSATSATTIQVRFRNSTPAELHPGALAYASPFSPTPEVTIFYDRIRFLAERRPGYEPRLLAHVLAHEIGHVLQRSNGHSESGVMKARWSAADHDRMAGQPLPFSETDRRLILEGLQARR